MAKRNRPILEPTTQAFIDTLEASGGKPLYALSYADARKVRRRSSYKRQKAARGR